MSSKAKPNPLSWSQLIELLRLLLPLLLIVLSAAQSGATADRLVQLGLCVLSGSPCSLPNSPRP
jgi:hypothetical protein